MKPFEIIDISGDAGIRAYGETVRDLFVSAAEGMYSLITDLDRVEEKMSIPVNVESSSIEGLLVSWLNELIFHFDTYGFVCRRVAVTELREGQTQGSGPAYSLNAIVSGEEFDTERHERRLLLKAATYHQLKIERKNGIWTANIIFDI